MSDPTLSDIDYKKMAWSELGLNAKCLTFLNAWKQMCSAGGLVPRNEFKLISPVLNSTKWESLKS